MLIFSAFFTGGGQLIALWVKALFVSRVHCAEYFDYRPFGR
jgi:hypothetical protein